MFRMTQPRRERDVDRVKTKVFISYSRRDGEFAAKLRAALTARGFQAYLDTRDISPGERWRVRLEELILAADAVVFIISPDSIASEHCAWEVARTLELKKNIIPLYWREAALPEGLSELNHVSFEAYGRSYIPDEALFEAAIIQLETALNIREIIWVREHTKWVARAVEWDRAEPPRPESKLLPTGDIAAIEAWAPLKTASAPEIPPVLRDYLRASKRTAGSAFVKPAQQAVEDGLGEHALRIAAAGALVAHDLGFELVPELWSLAARAVFGSKTRAVLQGHTDAVLSASFSPDGRRIVTTSKDGTARVWDVSGGKEIALLKAHEALKSALFSPDGRRIVTTSEDRTAHVWNAESGNEITTWKAEVDEWYNWSDRKWFMAAFSPYGRRIWAASHDAAWTWDAETGEEIICLKAYDRPFSDASFSEAGFRIVRLARRMVHVWDWDWDAERLSLISRLKTRRKNSVIAFSSDGRRMVTASNDAAWVWALDSGKRIAVLRTAGSVRSALFSPDGHRIVTTTSDSDGLTQVWHVGSRKEIAVLGAHAGAVKSVSFSPEGRRIVTTSNDIARMWDADSGAEITVFRGHEGTINSISFSPDGRRIATASSDGTAQVWDAACSTEIALLKGHKREVRRASFSPDGRRIVTASYDGTAVVWDAETGEKIALWTGHAYRDMVLNAASDGEREGKIALLKGQVERILSASFSPDGRQIVIGSDHGARAWDVESGKEIALCEDDRVDSASFSPDGRWILTGGEDGTARVWDAERGKEIALWQAHTNYVGAVNSASFSPDGRRILTASADGTARVWDAERGNEIALLKAHKGVVYCASFSADGRRILTASADGTARVWDAERGNEIALLKAHESAVYDASFSADGRRIVTASADGTARVWDVSRTELLVCEPAFVLAAALARGIGWRTDSERNDLLMQNAEDDLYAGALNQLNLAPGNSEIATLSVAFTAPLHPNCYLSPREFAETFAGHIHLVRILGIAISVVLLVLADFQLFSVGTVLACFLMWLLVAVWFERRVLRKFRIKNRVVRASRILFGSSKGIGGDTRV
jgi:WD40 repeat protein